MSSANPDSTTVPVRVQCASWFVGLALCIYGLLDGVAQWSFGYALTMLLIVSSAFLAWNWPGRRRAPKRDGGAAPAWAGHALRVALLAACSLGMSVWTARQLGDLPPAYHDEFSYLFQAKTFLAGRLSFPSHPTHPELFDQMHVLNDNGRMASRYFPGTGLWMAPFVACGHPYVGHWICSLLATVFVYAAGCELQSARTGLIAGFVAALSPGMALFGNLLLAHQPTLLGLSFFLWMMTRLFRTNRGGDALGAGIGLTWAMLCRPMTAAGFGLSFGVWTLWWLLRGSAPVRTRSAVFLGFAIPLTLGIGAQLACNQAITGSPWSSPYQLYTDIYTPRHVFGFNNVVRGERHLGPKVIDGYDRWAENLTPSLAVQNVEIRLGSSLLFIWDLLPLAMAACCWLFSWNRWDVRQQLIPLAILSLHAVHVPYWYAGIMGWHYVFETVILWSLLAGCVADRLLTTWRRAGQPEMSAWLSLFGAAVVAGNLVTIPEVWDSKISQALSSIRYPRRKQAEFQAWVKSGVSTTPALVLVAPYHDQGQLDYVVNEPGLDQPIVFGRFVPGKTQLEQIARDISERAVYLCEPDAHRLVRIPPPRGG